LIGIFGIQLGIAGLLLVIWFFLELFNSVGLPEYLIILFLGMLIVLFLGMLTVRNIAGKF